MARGEYSIFSLEGESKTVIVDLGFEGGLGCVSLMQKPWILQLLGLGFFWESGIVGLVFCK